MGHEEFLPGCGGAAPATGPPAADHSRRLAGRSRQAVRLRAYRVSFDVRVILEMKMDHLSLPRGHRLKSNPGVVAHHPLDGAVGEGRQGLLTTTAVALGIDDHFGAAGDDRR